MTEIMSIIVAIGVCCFCLGVTVAMVITMLFDKCD